MIEYLNLLARARRGTPQSNRTGIDTVFVPGGMMQFDLANGFPIVTTKRVAFRQVVGELLGFIRGYDNAAKFRTLGCNIWDKNANENKQWLGNRFRKGTDDLGRIYGVQWRDWSTDCQASHDQLNEALKNLLSDPTSRRIIVSAWRPDELDQMALPPCHLLYQFLVGQADRRLHMTMYMRSCDMFLGVPFNISSYALLLALVAKVTGYTPGVLTMFLADVHVYSNHLVQVDEQLGREPKPLPQLVIDEDPTRTSAIEWLERVEPEQIKLIGYDPHPPIRGEMAV